MKSLWIILAAVVVLAVLLIPMPISVRQELGWIDAIGGSQKHQTVWRVGRSSPPVVNESPLAIRFHQLGLQWQPDWRNVQGTYLNAFGRNVGHAHGSAPEIYTLALSPNLQRTYLATSTDAEVRSFFQVLSGGTEDEKKAACEAVCEKALEHATPTSP